MFSGPAAVADPVGKFLRQHRQHHSHACRTGPARGAASSDFEGPSSLTVLTGSRVGFSWDAHIRMIRVVPLPSRLKPISMPDARSDVWVRRNRPARALGDFGQPEPFVECRSAKKSALTRRRSDALPVHVAYLLIIFLMWAARRVQLGGCSNGIFDGPFRVPFPCRSRQSQANRALKAQY
jgi:hypothetical protein